MLRPILLLVRRDLSGMRALRIRKRIFISGGSVDRWHRYIEQSQVDEQLSAMVIPVIPAMSRHVALARASLRVARYDCACSVLDANAARSSW